MHLTPINPDAIGDHAGRVGIDRRQVHFCPS